MNKPLCLLVGEPSARTDILTEALEPWVTVINQSPRGCVETARATKPAVAVFVCSPNAGSHAHDLNKRMPGLPVVVEESEEHGRLPQNGFSALIDVDLSPAKLVERVKALCAPRLGALVPRQIDLARTFANYLPAIAASLDDSQRLSDQAITALRQASGASRALLYYANAPGSLFCRLSSSPPLAADSTTDTKGVAQALDAVGTALHASDSDLPCAVARFMGETQTNLIIPFPGEDGVAGWVAIHVNGRADAVDYQLLQTIVHFTAESIRSSRSRQIDHDEQAYWQAAFDQAFTAVILVGPDGRFRRVSDRQDVLKVAGAGNVRELKPRRLREAILQCLQGGKDISIWRVDSTVISVHRFASRGAMVLAQNHQSNPDEKSVPLTAPVWEHLASWAASISGEIPSDQCSLGTTLERLSQQPNIRLSLTNEDRQLVLKGRQNHAVTVFARGLLPLMGTSPANISCRRTSRQLHLDFVCEHSQPPTPEDAQALALGIVLLAGADIHVDRAVASLGVRWTLTISALPMKPNVEPV